ncbi:hypothetical protein AB0G54_33530 [Streptomyces yokosukanensis]|uniref:hypothetical protein n=1 Tax=Streptomyces yokosukanensis TaxID=67386 RepID=UPI00131AB76F|nr:hypothetical protein [Streptomyces yokosukanensis]
MNPSSAAPPGGRTDRGPVVGLLVATVLLLLPLVYGLYYIAHDSMECFGPTGCRGDHDDKASLARAAGWLVGGPSCGAVLFGLGGAVLRRRAGVWAAAGALLGTLVVWAAMLVWLKHSWENSNFEI